MLQLGLGDAALKAHLICFGQARCAHGPRISQKPDLRNLLKLSLKKYLRQIYRDGLLSDLEIYLTPSQFRPLVGNRRITYKELTA